ncbi:serine/threonine kinase 16 [Rhexocercosporidium sp. MPI-PUGE-AT-0058]|nr:serine/threonine kinase 16 [Rhexocercosporidium sp. MPI-PUGE-AT-0058]
MRPSLDEMDRITAAPPGTVQLHENTDKGDIEHLITVPGKSDVILQPQPSCDPNDPLNWSTWRKLVNFTIAALYTLWVYTILDIGTVAYSTWNAELGISYSNLSNAYACNTAALAVGGVILIPLTLKYGRRPVYLLTSLALTLSSVWMAKAGVVGDFIGSNLVSGLAGAVGDAIVQLTIADLFFTHQRGTMNGIYVLVVNLGVFAAPVASGYILTAQGWEWMYWYCVIFTGITFVAMIFFYEETKYTTPVINAIQSRQQTTTPDADKSPESNEKKYNLRTMDTNVTTPQNQQGGDWIDRSIPMNSYMQRLRLVSNTPCTLKEFTQMVFRPFIYLYCFPAVAYVSLQYGVILSLFAVVGNSQAAIFSLPPYNFKPSSIGLMSIPALIGAVFGSVYGGPLSDWLILVLAKRNNGIYEPEFRLYLCILPALLGPAGLLLYGVGATAGLPWIAPFCGIGLFGFALASVSNLSLVYLYDSYLDILGGTLVAVTVVRNGLATVIVFAFSPWVAGMGYRNTFILCAVLALIAMLTVIPMIIWGKTFRTKFADKYRRYALEDAASTSVRV